MRVVIQRVTGASVEINGAIHASIGEGLLILLGAEDADNDEDIEWLAGKIARLRVFNDQKGVMNLSVADVKGDILVISQFTLYASTKKGNRPSYSKAAAPSHAEPMYEVFARLLQLKVPGEVKTGVFGAMMQVSLVNDGPVTIIIDTKNKE